MGEGAAAHPEAEFRYFGRTCELHLATRSDPTRRDAACWQRATFSGSVSYRPESVDPLRRTAHGGLRTAIRGGYTVFGHQAAADASVAISSRLMQAATCGSTPAEAEATGNSAGTAWRQASTA